MTTHERDEAALVAQLVIASLRWWRCREYPCPRYAEMSESETDLFRSVGRLARIRGDDKPDPRWPWPSTG